MKKNFLCVLLSLVLVLGLMVIAAPNAFATEGETTEPAGHSHCVCVNSAAKPADHVCNSQQEWTAITGTKTISEDGAYFLDWTGNKAASITVSKNVNAYLCLNGARIFAGTTIKLNSGATLTICDCSAEGSGSITVSGGATTSPLTIGASQTVNLYSGNITGTGNGKSFASVTLSSSTAVFNMYGGSITGGSSDKGGNVSITRGVFTMYGGTISGGRATSFGGNVAVHTAASGTSTFVMNGGTISDGAVIGQEEILDADNNVTQEAIAGQGGNVSVNCSVGSFVMNNGTISNGTAADNGGNLFVASGTTTISGGSLTGGSAKNGGSIYAKNNVTLTGVSVSGGTATSNGGNIWSEKVVTIGEGTVISGGKATNGGNICTSGAGSNLIVNAGKIENGVATGNGGNAYTYNSSKIEITGGEISGGKATNGGNIYSTHTNMTATRKLTISGTTVSNGTAEEKGGNLYIAKFGIVKLENVTCDNGSAKDSGSNVYMEGNFDVTFTGGTYSVAEGGRKYTYTYPESSTATEEEKAAYLEQVAIYGLNNASTKLVSEGGKRLDGNGGNICIAWGNNKVTETTDSETGETVTQTTPNSTKINGTVITGGNAVNGGALYVGNANVTIENMTAKSCGGANGRVLHVAKAGVVTLKDSTLVNWGTQGSTVYNSGSLTLVGEVKLDKEFNATERKNGTAAVTTGMVLGAVENENAIIDFSGLTAVVNREEEGMPTVFGISMTRYGAVAEDDTKLAAAGKLATGINDTNRDFITLNNTGFALTETDGDLYMNDATIQGIKADGAITNGGADFAEITANHKDGVLYYIVNENLENAGELGVSIILDLNGKTVSGASVAAGYTLQLMDNRNDGYDADKCGKITVTGDIEPITHIIPVAGNRHYVALPNEDGSWSAHRYLAYTPSISFAPGADALGFNASFRGDTALQAQLTGYGFQMSVNDGAVKVYTKTDPFKNPAHTTLSLRVKNILANNGGEAKITGNAILVFQINGETVYADTSANSTTMKETVKIVNDMEAELNEEQKTAVYDLYTKYASVIDSWFTTEEINKIQTWGPAAE